jgi:hypothetical protein
LLVSIALVGCETAYQPAIKLTTEDNV